ncbi:MAG: hypothetical protein CENE_00377 [Candidatus Celerinatantimonas neptuna]|nr:MAG: hypothetical protein CENE_00377 [Candidatus Celerinatantimonas neptuna]
MAMNINNVSGNRSNTVDTNRTQDSRRSTTDNNVKNAHQEQVHAPQDSVVLTDKARQLNQIEQGLKEGNGKNVDNSQKIADLKQAIADGSYQINAPRVAKKMGTMEDQLNTLYR